MKRLLCAVIVSLLLVPSVFAYSSWGTIQGTEIEYSIKELRKGKNKNDEGLFQVEFKSNYSYPVTLTTTAYFMDSNGKIYARAFFTNIPVGSGSSVTEKKTYLVDGTFEEALKAYDIVFKDTYVRNIK